MKVSSLEAILRSLADAEVRYLIVGGLAVAAHGYGRLTFDLDLVVQLQPTNVLRALKALGSLGYTPLAPVSAADFADPAKRDAWIREKNAVVFQLHSERHRETRIDLFVAEPFDFEEEYQHAKTGELLPGLPAHFVRIAEGSWQAHNLSQLLYFRSLSLREKLTAVEGMAEVVRLLEQMRATTGASRGPSHRHGAKSLT